VKKISAQPSSTLRAVLQDLQPLHYSGGARPEEDLPGHVRAGSAVRMWNHRLAIIQDDTCAIALREEGGEVGALLLPWGDGHRRLFDDEIGNKKTKLDLEAGVTLPDGRLLALGSGSSSARERLVLATPPDQIRVVDGHALYAALRSQVEFAGSELNVEGAIVDGDRMRLFQRGNGAPRGDLLPVNATGDLLLAELLAWLDQDGPTPALHDVVQYDLGQVAGVDRGFTDACPLPDGRVAFLTGAEDSPDAVRDGEVVGCGFGIIVGDLAWHTDIIDSSGQPSLLKIEGLELLAWQPRPRFAVVMDMDSPSVPALLGSLEVEGLAQA